MVYIFVEINNLSSLLLSLSSFCPNWLLALSDSIMSSLVVGVSLFTYGSKLTIFVRLMCIRCLYN